MRASARLAAAVSLLAIGFSNFADAEVKAPPPSKDRNCRTDVPFARWIEDFKKEAIAEGIKPQTIQNAIGGMTPDQGIIGRDRKQGFFSQTFVDFYGKLASKGREQNGRAY